LPRWLGHGQLAGRGMTRPADGHHDQQPDNLTIHLHPHYERSAPRRPRNLASDSPAQRASLHRRALLSRLGRMSRAASLPEIVFTTPRNLPDARKLRGRVAVVDIAFAADGMGTPFAETTGAFIRELGGR